MFRRLRLLMIESRFNPSALWSAHFGGLRWRDYSLDPDEAKTEEEAEQLRKGQVDWLSVIILYFPPATASVLTYCLKWAVGSPELLLAAASLLAGGFLTSFSQLASWRERLSRRASDKGFQEQGLRDLIDASVAHVSVAIYACIALAAWIVLAGNFANWSGALRGIWAVVGYGIGAYIVMLVVLIIPALYSAYEEINELDDGIAGRS